MPRDPDAGGPGDRERLEHMLGAARDASSFVAARRRIDLDSDAMLRRALVHALLEVGEAASRITASGRARIPAIPWSQVVAARNILVHVYWGIDADLVWKMAVEDLPPLISALERALANWPAP